MTSDTIELPHNHPDADSDFALSSSSHGSVSSQSRGGPAPKFIIEVISRREEKPDLVINRQGDQKPAFYASSGSASKHYDITLHRGALASGPVACWVNIYDRYGYTSLVFAGGKRTEVRCDNVFTSRYRGALPTAPATATSRSGEPRDFFWKNGGIASVVSGGGMRLVDQHGVVYAHFTKGFGAGLSRRVGKLSVCVEGLEDDFIEQIVASCVTMLEIKKREKKDAEKIHNTLVNVLD